MSCSVLSSLKIEEKKSQLGCNANGIWSRPNTKKTGSRVNGNPSGLGPEECRFDPGDPDNFLNVPLDELVESPAFQVGI